MRWLPWVRFFRWLSRATGRPAVALRPARRPDADMARIRPQTDSVVWRIQSAVLNYRRILDQNNAVLTLMTEMERTLGGEYIFDRTFLENAVRRLSARVHHVTYNLNALTGNAYVALYDRFQEIQAKLYQILAGDPAADKNCFVIPFERIDWDMEPQVGLPAVCLGELRKRTGIRIMDGFVVTSAALNGLLSGTLEPAKTENGNPPCADQAAGSDPQAVRLAIEEGLRTLTPNAGAEPHFTLSLVLAGAPLQPPQGLRTGVSATQAWSTIREMASQAFSQLPDFDHLAPVIMVQEEIAAPVEGQVLTRVSRTVSESAGHLELMEVTVWKTEAPRERDRYLLRRAHPFDAVLAELNERPLNYRFSDGRGMFDAGAGPLLRGSALLSRSTSAELAETVLVLERLLGTNCMVSWRLLDNTPAVCQIAPVPPAAGQPIPDLPALLAKTKVLGRGGHTVQSGIAAGVVVPVSEASSPQDFPAGAIAVAPTASPRLAPLLQRAGAVLTATGTTGGHLATVARELRVPAVFGMPDLLHDLTAGARVTVDASECVVYEGVLDELLRYAGSGADLDPGDPEYRLLRRLLRFIMPLHLVDPQATDFTPQNCRSYHDIIHFCHERAVNELAHLQEKRPGLGGLHTRRLETGVPLEMRVLDIGGGLSPEAPESPQIIDLRCEPLKVFLEGLNRPEAWEHATAELSIRDVLSGLAKTADTLNAPAESLSGNLAIIGGDYLNLSLRLGYHFSVIDALLGRDLQRNYVYFRFAGGLAEARKRERRARFISQVLTALDFNVSQKGDLVVGRLKLVPLVGLRRAIRTLGMLTAFVRQRDTALHSDNDAQELFGCFAGRFMQPADSGWTEGESCSSA